MTKEDGRGMQAERQSNQEKDGKSSKVGAKWKTQNKGDDGDVQPRVAFLSQVLRRKCNMTWR